MNHAIALIALLTVEYLADFVLQSREVATKKSESLEHLQSHVLTIIGALYIPAAIILCISWGSMSGLIGAAFFSVINGVIHGLCDWNIWKGYKYLVAKSLKWNKIQIDQFVKHKRYAEDSRFYNTIGLDRLIHVSTIIFLYFWFI